MKTPDIQKVLGLYYSKTEIGNDDIKELFSCGDNTAVSLKKKAREEMAKTGVRTWIAKNVDTACAFRAWHIDIEQLEQLVIKRQKLVSKGVAISG